MKNVDVVRAWSEGRVAASRHITTDGKSLFSYQMEIGRIFERNGLIVRQVLNVRAPNNYSMTTSQHVTRAAAYATELIDPVPTLWNGKRWYVFPESPAVLSIKPQPINESPRLSDDQINALIVALQDIAEVGWRIPASARHIAQEALFAAGFAELDS